MQSLECISESDSRTFQVNVEALLASNKEYFSRLFFPAEYGFSDQVGTYELNIGETYQGIEDALEILQNNENDIPVLSIHAIITLDKWMCISFAYLIDFDKTEDVILPITSHVVKYVAENLFIQFNINIPEGYIHYIRNVYDLVFVLCYNSQQLIDLSPEETLRLHRLQNKLYFWDVDTTKAIQQKIKEICPKIATIQTYN